MNNAIARNNTTSAVTAWNLNRGDKGVTVAVIGDEESIAFAKDIIERGSAPALNPSPSLLEMKILTAPKSSAAKPSKAAHLGRLALRVGLGAAGAAVGFTAGALGAAAFGALGIVGGAVAGAALAGVGVATDKLSLATLGATAGAGALALTGSPIAGGLLALGLVGTSVVGIKAGVQFASKLLKD